MKTSVASKPKSHVPVPGNATGKNIALPKQVKVPPEPSYDEDVEGERALHDEQQVFRVEALMLKGIRDHRRLMQMLQITDKRKIDRYIARVLARWELQGSSNDLSRARGEALARLDMIEAKLWAKIDAKTKAGDDPRISVASLKVLVDLQKQRNEVSGLSEKAIERLLTQDPSSALTFTENTATHAKLATLAKRILGMIERGDPRLRALTAPPEDADYEDAEIIEGDYEDAGPDDGDS